MALTRDLAYPTRTATDLARCFHVREALVQDGLYHGSQKGRSAGEEPPVATRWRIAPAPFLLSPEDVAFFRSLGNHLLAFYRALNRLYLDSVRGTQPAWIAAYLDQGKPESLIAYSRMKRFRDLLPGVIRPDIIPTDESLHGYRMVITELDSVPGGIGLTGALAKAYGQVASGKWQVENQADSLASTSRPSPLAPRLFEIVGGLDGMARGFAAMLRAQLGDRDGCVAIVVSDEAKDYRPEMQWMAARLRSAGLEAYCVEPHDIRFTEEALLVGGGVGDRPVSLAYRFFELFDLKNIPKSELIMYSAKKDRTFVTPPFKPALEEKLAFALFHHPVLTPFWMKELGEESYGLLAGLLPRTWILDPRPLPPSAVIPGLRLAGRAVADWHELAGASQKDRQYAVKPSGFSELAWGSRGVSVGHDLSQTEWAEALDKALASFPTIPYVLQEFHKGRQYALSYYDEGANEIVPMAGRARLSPYYFVTGERAELGGVLATVCPLDKKLIHGMRDAIMTPCALLKGSDG
ncbi:MAG: hypothetical protein FJ249_07475 [Nitrospira sp.]|nr:hypothetical protein [Nitrospira sp.]